MRWMIIGMILGALALSAPLQPAIYYGEIYGCDLENAVIKAMVGEELRGETQITPKDGVYTYGGPHYGEGSLPVTLYPEDGNATVKFLICTPYGCATVGEDTPTPGEWKEMDFSLTSSQCSGLKPREEKKGGGGGGGGLGPEVPKGKPEEYEVPEIPEGELPPENLVKKRYSWEGRFESPSSVGDIVPEGLDHIVRVTVKRRSGTTGMRAEISELAGLGSLPAPGGNPVFYFSLAVDEDTLEDMEEVIVEFRVPVDGVDPERIALLHFVNGEWTEEETEFTGEENGYYYFRARVTHLSYFAVVEKPAEEKESPEEETKEEEAPKEEKGEEKPVEKPAAPEKAEVQGVGGLPLALVILGVFIVAGVLYFLLLRK